MERGTMAGILASWLVLGVVLAGAVRAGELEPLQEIPKITNQIYDLRPFCANYGDFVSCSTGLLNFSTNGGVDATGQIVNRNANQLSGMFSINASQGFIGKDDVIAVYTYDGAYDNPTQAGVHAMDDAFVSKASQNKVRGFSTDQTPSAAESTAGVTPEPDPDSDGDLAPGDFTGDTPDTWDIQLSALIAGLELADGTLRDPVFVFDNNQQGSDPNESLKLWGLMALRDSTGTLPGLVFEFRGCDKDEGPDGDPAPCAGNTSVLEPDNNETIVDPAVFSSDKVLGDDPLLDEYALVQGAYCVDATFNEVACDGSELVRFDQNLGDGRAEFFAFLPELTGSKLQDYLDKGYDLLSMDMRFFDQTDGFEDLFILAMGTVNTTIPEPGSLALLGLGGLGFAAVQRRLRRA